MKLVLIDKAGMTVHEAEAPFKEPPTVCTFVGEAFIYRAAKSNNRRATYQLVSTYACPA